MLRGADTTRTGHCTNSTNPKHTIPGFWNGDAMKDLFSREQRREFMSRRFQSSRFHSPGSFHDRGSGAPLLQRGIAGRGSRPMPMDARRRGALRHPTVNRAQIDILSNRNRYAPSRVLNADKRTDGMPRPEWSSGPRAASNEVASSPCPLSSPSSR